MSPAAELRLVGVYNKMLKKKKKRGLVNQVSLFELIPMCCGSLIPGTLFGYDTDVLLSYRTPKIVRVLDAKLGCLKYSFTLAILLYVVVYKLICQLGYVKFETPQGTVRFSLFQPTADGCDPFKNASCYDNFTALTRLPYCIQSPSSAHRDFPPKNCTYWDAVQDQVVGQSAITLTTRVTEYAQERACHTIHGNQTSCHKLWKNVAPVEGSTYFIADVDRFTLLIDHSVGTPTLNLSATSRQMAGSLHVRSINAVTDTLCSTDPTAITTDSESSGSGGSSSTSSSSSSSSDAAAATRATKAPCVIPPRHPDGESLDIYEVGTLLQAAGVDLDSGSFGDGHSQRYEGAILLLYIRYANTYSWSGVAEHIRYEYESAQLVDATFKSVDAVYTAFPNARQVRNRHGVRIFVVQTGRLGVFDGTQLLLQLTTSLTLLALANTVVDYLMIYGMPLRNLYKKYKYEVTEDMSDRWDERAARRRGASYDRAGAGGAGGGGSSSSSGLRPVGRTGSGNAATLPVGGSGRFSHDGDDVIISQEVTAAANSAANVLSEPLLDAAA